jgi:uncharacterized delta-60 repeat protein
MIPGRRSMAVIVAGLALATLAGPLDAAALPGEEDGPELFESRHFDLDQSCADTGRICTWERAIGGPLAEKAYAVAEMADGGFAVAGHTMSNGRFRDDALVVRFDRSGNTLWGRVFGGRDTEQLYGIVALDDGGVAVAGYTRSYGDGQSDAWVVRLDADGKQLWQRTFGGPENDKARSIAATADGGLIVAGSTRSRGAGEGDAWILRLDPDGTLAWQTVHGAAGDDGAYNIIPVPGGGFAVAGYSQPVDAKPYDLWVLRLDDDGRIAWEQRFVRGVFGAATGLTPAPDGGLYVVGMSHESSAEMPKVWVLRLDGGGALVWQKLIGGPKTDGGWGIAATADGGFVVMAATASQGAGSTDAWLMQFDPAGELVWERLFGQSLWDLPTAILVTRDGGLMVAGYTTSQGNGQEDFWLLRLDDQGELGSGR